ncbi:uncharacterized protein LOC129773505 [Toxorhynchites rutilus septentrionalis]|uniref:uncharacterized protein LOC129773505 n=1 Tax=Toxorhynchites rutilus septentrionalis TaxID=329112 RepID=UPI00247A2A28|nr:uncharacterized protein LOC129773505 [Toxorhynchites rutilus septentrionalis]
MATGAERKLRGLKNRKRSILASFACITEFADNFQAEYDALELSVRLDNLAALWTEFNSVQSELEVLEDVDEVMDAYLKDRTEFDRCYYRTKDLPSVSVDVSTWDIPNGIQLADPSFYKPSNIDVIIGAELFFDIFNPSERILLGNSLPWLINSKVGWIVSGNTHQKYTNIPFACNIATTSDLHRDMERFWSIEDDSMKAFSPQETASLCTTLAIINKPGHIESRFNRTLAKEYRDFMDEYLRLGHMQQIEEVQTTTPSSFFPPHHPVIREDHTTTKVRVVFDASCKSATGLSLNDILEVGPVIQDDLRSIVMRSRLHSFLLIADITKMFRQINLHHKDTPYQRIFWRSSSSEPVRMYELKTVTYGTASAPYLATRVLKQLAKDEEQNYPLASRATLVDFYMDDFVSGTSTIYEAIELQNQMDSMFKSAGMQLRKWACNSSEILKYIPENNRALESSVDLDKDKSIKTLGLHWEPMTDRLKYMIQLEPDDVTQPITKRTTLSCIARIFDPLGLVGPVVVTAKIFMQILWSLREENGKVYDWDCELPADIKNQWNTFYMQLDRLNEFRIERQVLLPDATSIEMHIFSDASEHAYGACVYLRTANSLGEIKVALLTSRSKVSPLKQLSIPRLELCAALIAAELHQKVLDSLRLEIVT